MNNISPLSPRITVNAGDDRISGNGANDILLGGSGRDAIFGDNYGELDAADAGSDLIFGDNGDINTTVPGYLTTVATAATFIDPTLLPLAGALIFSFTAIDEGDFSVYPDSLGELLGDDDYIEGNGNDDIILGQQGRDTIYAGAGNDDVIGGHNVVGGDDEGDFIDAGSGLDVVAGDNAQINRRWVLDADANVRERFRQLSAATIYGEDIPGGTDGQVQVQLNGELDISLPAATFPGARHYAARPLADHTDQQPRVVRR